MADHHTLCADVCKGLDRETLERVIANGGLSQLMRTIQRLREERNLLLVELEALRDCPATITSDDVQAALNAHRRLSGYLLARDRQARGV